MIYQHRKTLIAVSLVSLLVIGIANADMPDENQRSWISSTSFDLPQKFYAGVNLGYSNFYDKTLQYSNKSANLATSNIDVGAFAGYKFSPYTALEVNFQHLGTLSEGSAAFPLDYTASIYNISADGILSYPFINKENYTFSIYGKAGYGFNFANYNYSISHGAISDSGTAIGGVFNLGAGVNLDLLSSISTRLDYTYYQTKYPLPGNGNSHADSVLTLGIYYNF
jgi:hypothetical protein